MSSAHGPAIFSFLARSVIFEALVCIRTAVNSDHVDTEEKHYVETMVS